MRGSTRPRQAAAVAFIWHLDAEEWPGQRREFNNLPLMGGHVGFCSTQFPPAAAVSDAGNLRSLEKPFLRWFEEPGPARCAKKAGRSVTCCNDRSRKRRGGTIYHHLADSKASRGSVSTTSKGVAHLNKSSISLYHSFTLLAVRDNTRRAGGFLCFC